MTQMGATTTVDPITTPAEAGAPPTTPRAKRTLKQRAVRSSVWSVSGFTFNQAVRFVTNLALTYLLVPEAFGLMALINLTMTAMSMFSEIGVRPSVIQNKRGDDAEFLNTAWTMQIIRGACLWLFGCAIAYPVSLVKPEWEPFRYLLPVAALGALIGGFRSTKLITASRKLALGRVSVMGMGIRVLTAGVMVSWAWYTGSVWALILGNLASAWMQTIFSHAVLKGKPNRLQWDWSAAREMFNFGRWIFVSTIITFFAMQIDKLLLESLLGLDRLGVYWIAFSLTTPWVKVLRRLSGQIGFPMLSELHRRNDKGLRRKFARMHRYYVIAGAGMQGGLALIGPWIVTLIYPETFRDASWMLAALAVNGIASMVCSGYDPLYLALGATKRYFVSATARLILIVALPCTGYALGGEVGFILGLAAVDWVRYPVEAFMAWRLGYWQPLVDLTVLAVGALVAAVVALPYVL